jgi:GxxExxY protein
MAKIILAKESYAIVGACFAVYNEKGHCFTEPIFHECLEIELEHLGIPFLSKPPLKLTYRSRTLTHTFEPDFLCYERIVLEIKAVQALTDAHRAQVINYVHTADLDLGLLVNFGSYPNLQWERFLHSRLSPRKTIADDPPSF